MKDAEDEAFDELAKRQGMWGGGFQAKRAAAADKQEPAQEPVAWMWKDMRGQDVVSLFEPRLNSIPLYTPPPKREWVDLTDADADDLFVETQRHMIGVGSKEFTRIFTRLINAKLKEQNNG